MTLKVSRSKGKRLHVVPKGLAWSLCGVHCTWPVTDKDIRKPVCQNCINEIVKKDRDGCSQ